MLLLSTVVIATVVVGLVIVTMVLLAPVPVAVVQLIASFVLMLRIRIEDILNDAFVYGRCGSGDS